MIPSPLGCARNYPESNSCLIVVANYDILKCRGSILPARFADHRVGKKAEQAAAAATAGQGSQWGGDFLLRGRTP